MFSISEHGVYYSQENEKIPSDLLDSCRSDFDSLVEKKENHAVNNDNFTFIKQPFSHKSFFDIVLLDEVLRHPFEFFQGKEFFLGTVNLRRSKYTKTAEGTTTLYHRDQNLGSIHETRGNFLKVFVYLTDVSLETGPFTYIIRSNRGPSEPEYRVSDQKVHQIYGKESEVKCIAPAGTILSADTTGLHKGIKVLKGHRDMFTMNFCTKKEKNTELFEVKQQFLSQKPLSVENLFKFYTKK